MTEPHAIRVLIADDHTVVREGLVLLLDTFLDLQMVGEATDGAQAILLCAEHQPDVVLMDLVMPGIDGVTAIQAIHQKHPETQILALTSFNEEELVYAALEAGAIGYLMKNISATELAEAIRAAHARNSTLAPEATQALIHAATRSLSPGHDLTEREREVLKLLVKGLSNAQIAEQLGVSPYTIRNHVSRIFSKLNVSSRTEAATLAIQYKIVDLISKT
jgi:NarL family two-component system response regulator LiaR